MQSNCYSINSPVWSTGPAVTAHDADEAVRMSQGKRRSQSVAASVVERQNILSACTTEIRQVSHSETLKQCQT